MSNSVCANPDQQFIIKVAIILQGLQNSLNFSFSSFVRNPIDAFEFVSTAWQIPSYQHLPYTVCYPQIYIKTPAIEPQTTNMQYLKQYFFPYFFFISGILLPLHPQNQKI
jgi:hypothetical protein